MTLSKRDAKLLLILLGIVILLVGYLAVYSPYTAKTSDINTEIAGLEPELTELQGYYANIDNYYSGIDIAEESISSEMENYPTDVRPEDMIMYAIDLEDLVGLDVTSISFSEPTALLSIPSVFIDENDNVSVKDASAYQVSMTVTCNVGYRELKDMIGFLNATQYRTTLDTVSVSFDSETGELTGSATINKFYISSGDEEYVPTPVPSVPIGTDDLFGTFSTGTATPDVTDEAVG